MAAASKAGGVNGTAGDASVITTGGSSATVAQNGTVAGASDVQAQYESLKTKYRVSLSQPLIFPMYPNFVSQFHFRVHHEFS